MGRKEIVRMRKKVFNVDEMEINGKVDLLENLKSSGIKLPGMDVKS